MNKSAFSDFLRRQCHENLLLRANAGLASLTLIASCTTVDSRLDSNRQTGYFREVYSAEKLHTDPLSCLRALSAIQHAADIYVEIEIHHGRVHEYLAAKVPQGLIVHEHNEVDFCPKHCAQGVVPETMQISKHAS